MSSTFTGSNEITSSIKGVNNRMSINTVKLVTYKILSFCFIEKILSISYNLIFDVLLTGISEPLHKRPDFSKAYKF